MMFSLPKSACLVVIVLLLFALSPLMLGQFPPRLGEKRIASTDSPPAWLSLISSAAFFRSPEARQYFPEFFLPRPEFQNPDPGTPIVDISTLTTYSVNRVTVDESVLDVEPTVISLS